MVNYGEEFIREYWEFYRSLRILGRGKDVGLRENRQGPHTLEAEQAQDAAQCDG